MLSKRLVIAFVSFCHVLILSESLNGQCLLSEDVKFSVGPNPALTEWAPRYQLVDVFGDRAIVSSPNNGIVTIFRLSGGSWVQEQTLSGTSGSTFGAGIALGDDVAVVGHPYGNSFAGVAYVYRRSGTTWTLEQTLSVTGTTSFGGSVAVDGSVVLIGAGNVGVPGRAYIFRHNGSSWVEEQQLIASGPGTREAYGQSVSLDGNVALVGCPLHNNARGVDAGSMYVFRYDGSTWVQEQEILASDGATGDYFGWKVSLKGNVAVAGAQNVDVGGLLSVGAAYIFQFDGSNWVQTPRLLEQNLVEGASFGVSVAASENVVLVGADGIFTSSAGWSGLFRVYRTDGVSWYLDRTLGVSQRSDIGYFVAADGNRVILGSALGFDSYRAFLYDLGAIDCNGNGVLDAADIANGPSVDCQPNCIPDECELADESQTDCNTNSTLDVCDIASGQSLDCNFNFLPDECDVANGASDCDQDLSLEVCPEQLSSPFPDAAVAFDSAGNAHVRGDVAIVGDSRADHPSLSATGKAIVYQFDGVHWAVEQSLYASDGESGDAFGAAVSIVGDVAIVGAPDEDHAPGSNVGAAYVFRRIGDTWVEESKLIASDGESNDHFGNAVGIDGDLALVAAYLGPFAPGSSNIGCVYAFRRVGGTWVEEQKLGDVTTPGAQDRFGISLSMRGNRAAIGADKDITPTLFVQGGVAHVFRHNGTAWVSEAKVWPADAVAGLEFGSSVAISDNWLAVGSEVYFAGGKFNLGAVYLYQFNGSSWIFHAKLTAPDGADGDRFGHALGLDGSSLLIGAQRDDNHVSSDAGSAYLYEWNGAAWSTSAKLASDDAVLYGSSVSVDGNHLLVKSGFQSLVPPFQTGAAHFYGISQLDCNASESPDRCELFSNQSKDCQSNDLLDECDIALGHSVDANADLIPDECTTTTPVADESTAVKTRFISFSLPSELATETALRVQLISLHHVDPPYTGGPSVPFTSFEGQVRWVGPPTQYLESSSSGIPFHAASLQCTPHYQDWSTVGLLHVTGSAVVPSSVYEVENVAASCMGVEETCTAVSEPLTILTTRWADVETPFNPPSTSAQPDLADVSALVNKFRNAPGAPIKARALLVGGDSFGTIDIATEFSFIHIAGCVDAFRGRPYPHQIGTCP